MSIKKVQVARGQGKVYEALGIDKDDSVRRGKKEPMGFRRQKAVPKRKAFVPYVFNPDAPHPIRGESVAVCHKSTLDQRGVASVRRADIEHRTIARVYMSDINGFSIRDNAGDTWYIRPASLGSSKWETFIPGEKQKVFK